MSFVRDGVTIGSREITIETGKWAKQAGGSVVVRCGDSMVLVTATGSKDARDLPFMPLTCEYQEKNYSAGKIPGSFFRREGRLSAEEVLICRLMDRPIRPLFPEGWRIDTQVIATVVSFDKQNATDVLAMTGASASLHISDLQFDGPVAAIRVGRVDGELVPFPTYEERLVSDLDLVISASREAIVMVEGEMSELTESEVIDALLFAHESVQPLLDLQEKLRAAAGKEKRAFTPPEPDESLYAAVADKAWGRVVEAMAVKDKHARSKALSEIGDAVKSELCEGESAPYAGREGDVSGAYGEVKSRYARTSTIETKTRIDGRQLADIRDISSEVAVLPSAHGSSLFTRGETQALVSATLGTKYDEQRLDTLLGFSSKRFFLHYNFPPFSTGEVKPIRGTGRREIGHGFLAERSISRVLPKFEDFPYTLRVVSEILESNGSSSMASVCGASLALMDAGVPITSPVAGIAMGLMKEGEDYAILSDILGDEDHLGDMDFKVTGTRKGICALQMDIKLKGLTREILGEALEQARKGRLHILDAMQEALAMPRDDLSPRAPRIVSISVNPEKIRDVIGPGGKTIRAITEQTGANVDVADDGTVSVASADGKSLNQALDLIKGLTMEPEVGAFYTGVVKRIVEFGAFVEIMPGTDGLLHISELAEERTRRVSDVVEEGDEVVVKCISIDRDGKIRLSRREAQDVDPADVQNFTM